VREYTVKIEPQGKHVNVPEGVTLFEAIHRAGVLFDAPCGGNGTCGKCIVRVIDGTRSGVVLSCRTEVWEDTTLEIPETGEHHILTTAVGMDFEIEPLVRRVPVVIPRGEPQDRRSEWQRLKGASGVTDAPVNVPLAACLPDRLAKCGGNADVVVFDNDILDVRAPGGRLCVSAFDLGTTTIVGWLLDGETGETLAVSSMLNPQVQFGADVIGRANYALETDEEVLTEVVRSALDGLIKEMAQRARVSREDIYVAVVVGNTCMHHLFLGLTPASLVLAPYRPALTEHMILNAGQYVDIHPWGKLLTLPNVAGFVGSDTVAVMVATGLDKTDELTLAIDIGTNGELVLADRHRMTTCSTAAGPAFEGAKIACGMRGTTGAIDHARRDEEGIHVTVIGGGKPRGICGSGLMDLVAHLLDMGIIDSTGRFNVPEKGDFTENFIEINNQPAFVVSEEVYLTQRDIREVQLAKAAMAAGIRLLAKSMGVRIEDIRKVLIAGAFGNFMNPASAARIGLIPPEIESKVVAVGNAAGEGARMVALSRTEWRRAAQIAQTAQYLDLAGDPDFQDCFVDEMVFPTFGIDD
jgi:uncharacterized 2Fe-2S/4Fe-4S cluster protein (DUF4445 family)